MSLRRLCLLLALASFALASAADARVHRVHPGQSIQAAIDAASPGDTILVSPGDYYEKGNATYGLRISTPRLRLIGLTGKGGRSGADSDSDSDSDSHKKSNGKAKPSKVRLLHYGTQETGIYAAPEGCEYKDVEGTCPDVLKGFYLRGFSVQNFPVNGIQTRWVHGFKFIRNESIKNLNNGIYPTLSAHGLVKNNFSYGSQDTALWVAGSEYVRVIGNELTNAPTGLEITVANEVYAAYNNIYGNTVGVGLYHPEAAGNPQKPVMKNWVIEKNWIHDNNEPGLAPPGTFQELLPPGGGVLILGVSDHVVGKNWIWNNDFFGIAMLGWCTAVFDSPRMCTGINVPNADPSVGNNRIYRNWLKNNGSNPPASPLSPLASDMIYIQTPLFNETGTGNCYEDNVFDTFFSFPDGPPPFGGEGALPTDGC